MGSARHKYECSGFHAMPALVVPAEMPGERLGGEEAEERVNGRRRSVAGQRNVFGRCLKR